MKSNNFQATVNDEFDFEKLSLARLDVVNDDNGRFHILHNDRSFHGELLHADPAAKKYTIKVNGNVYDVSLSDEYDQLIRRMGLEVNIQHKVSEVKAPMPGMVLSISVQEGQEVSLGDPLLILEAMKMENVIKSPGDGVIKEIVVQTGTPVEKGQVLIELE